jgi:orotate phosphoribosyltransferase
MQLELLDLMVARSGHFQLESGRHGDLWLDLDALFMRPARLQQFVAALAARLAAYRVGAVCGPLVGGAFLAQSVAAALDAEFCYTERHLSPPGAASGPVRYHLPASLRHTVNGRTVAIVDDVIYAGSAVRGTLAELRACGAVPAAIAALLVLGSAAPSLCAHENITLECLVSLPNESWPPSECPLCAAQVPLEQAAPSDADFCENSRERAVASGQPT